MNANDSDPRYVIVAAVDETPSADLVIAHAAQAARAHGGSELHLLHVPDRFTHNEVKRSTFDLGHADQFMDKCARLAREASGVTTIGHVLERDPASAILQLAASLDADLVIVGTRDKHGPARWILGSVAGKVMQRAPCPVLVVRQKQDEGRFAPGIEPPCPECLRKQRASNSTQMWCARHLEHHPRAHLHYEMPKGYGAGSNFIIPS